MKPWFPVFIAANVSFKNIKSGKKINAKPQNIVLKLTQSVGRYSRTTQHCSRNQQLCIPTVEWHKSHLQVCYRQGSVCTSAPRFLHSFGSTGNGHMARKWCTVHHPCRSHSLSHHAHRKMAVHVRRRELAAHILSLLHNVPGQTSTQQFAVDSAESHILVHNCSTKVQKSRKLQQGHRAPLLQSDSVL